MNFVLRDYDGSAPNLSECCVPFLPSVDIERGFRRKSGAGGAGGGGVFKKYPMEHSYQQ